MKSLFTVGVLCISTNDVQALQLGAHVHSNLSVKSNVQSNITNLMQNK